MPCNAAGSPTRSIREIVQRVLVSLSSSASMFNGRVLMIVYRPHSFLKYFHYSDIQDADDDGGDDEEDGSGSGDTEDEQT